MLEFMRRHAQSWFIKVLLGGIVVTFISWGGYSRYQERASTVAYVNGEPIPIQEYERSYMQALNFARAQLGGELSEEQLASLKLRERVYDQLVERILLLQEAERLGIEVTDAELRERIAAHPVFQFQGGFSEERYRKLLAANNLTPAQFEAEQRAEALTEKLRRLVMGFAKVSEAEAFADWRQRNEKVAVDYASFPSTAFLGAVKITEADLKSYYEKRQEAFRQPARVKIGYVVFDLGALAKELAPSEELVRQDYEQFQEDYWTPKEVKARHILLTVGAGASKEHEAKVEQKALSLLSQARAGADFAELARQHSEDPGSKDKGGELGWFGEGQMVEEFEQAAFALPKGGLGGPVRTPFGYHIIKVEDVKEPRRQTYEEVREQIARAIAQAAAEEQVEKRLAATHAKALKAGGLKKLAEAEGLAYQETGFLAAGEAIAGLADSGRVVAQAAGRKAGDIGSDEERELGPVLFQVVERRESYIPPLSEVEVRVRQKMAAEKSLELAGDTAAAMLADIKAGVGFEQAAAKRGAKVGRTNPFTRQGAPAEVGSEAAKAAFRLKMERPVASIPYRNAAGFVVVRLAERIDVQPAEFSAQKEQAVQGLLAYKRQQIYDDWLKRLREKADIEVVNKVF